MPYSLSTRCLVETMRGEHPIRTSPRVLAQILHANWDAIWSDHSLAWHRYLHMLVQHDLLQTLIALLQEPSVVRMPMPSALFRVI